MRNDDTPVQEVIRDFAAEMMEATHVRDMSQSSRRLCVKEAAARAVLRLTEAAIGTMLSVRIRR